MSIPSEHRLRKHSEFELVYRLGRRHFSQVLTAFYLVRVNEKDADRQAGHAARVGITVGRALGKATVRNRIKRRVRAAITANLARLTRPLDVVINPKKAVLDVDFQQLCSEVTRAFDVIEQKAVYGESQNPEKPSREQRLGEDRLRARKTRN